MDNLDDEASDLLEEYQALQWLEKKQEHDCHASPEDGCAYCAFLKRQTERWETMCSIPKVKIPDTNWAKRITNWILGF